MIVQITVIYIGIVDKSETLERKNQCLFRSLPLSLSNANILIVNVEHQFQHRMVSLKVDESFFCFHGCALHTFIAFLSFQVRYFYENINKVIGPLTVATNSTAGTTFRIFCSMFLIINIIHKYSYCDQGHECHVGLVDT